MPLAKETVGEDVRRQNPSNLSDQEKINQTEIVTQGTKKKLQDKQRGSRKRAVKPDKELCEPAGKAQQKSSGQPANTSKYKITENKLPDVLQQLLRPDTGKDDLPSDSQQQLPDASSPTGFAAKTFMSLVLESLFYSLYREDEEQQDICLSIARSQKMESDAGRQQETKAGRTKKEQKTNTPRTPQRQQVDRQQSRAEPSRAQELHSAQLHT